MKYAILRSGGRQLRAQEGDVIEVERLDVNVGDEIEIQDVLLYVEDDHVTVGTPTVAGARALGTVLGQVKGPKIIVFKFKPKQRYRRKTGHRQKYTQIRVDRLVAA